jgi:hypothetical protein
MLRESMGRGRAVDWVKGAKAIASRKSERRQKFTKRMRPHERENHWHVRDINGQFDSERWLLFSPAKRQR